MRRSLRRLLGRRQVLVRGLQSAVAVLAAACLPRRTPEPSAQGAGDQPQQLVKVDLAFCSQLLCILPFEVAVKQGFFRAEGLDVNLIYMRGGALAIEALVSESVNVAGSALDVVVQANAQGKRAVMFASTSRVPFFALVTSPREASVRSVRDLEGKRIGVNNLNTADHLLARYLLVRSGLNPERVEFVALGPNLYDFVLRGEVQAGMVQDPARTLLLRQGATELVNFMSVEDSQRHLGGPYQFMGVSTRPDVMERDPELLRKLARGLARASQWILEHSGSDIVKMAPPELIAGGDVELFAQVLDEFKDDLYPTDMRLVHDNVQRVIDVQVSAGAIPAGRVRAEDLYTNAFLGS